MTGFHRRILLSYKAKQAKTPTLAGMIQGYWMVALSLIVGALLADAILFVLHLSALAYLIAGGVLGWLIHTIWMYQKNVEGWPVVEQLLDWQKIDELLDQAETEAKSAQSAV